MSTEFQEEYFHNMGYLAKEKVIKSHVLEVLTWASRMLNKNLLKGARRSALDVGCACGYSSAVLEQLGYRTVAVDVSKWGVQNAKRVCCGDLLVCDAQTNLPFNERSFDLVTCFDVLEHLEFPEKTLREMLRVCNGAMTCTTPNGVIEKHVKRIVRDYDETHINSRSARRWEESVLNIRGLKMVKVDTFLDFSGKLPGHGFFYKSFRLPKLGLTTRLAVVV